HEAAVLVEIVDRVRAPELVIPHVQRLVEPVDVLGHSELLDPALGRLLAVALGVRTREEPLRRVLALVRPQVDVVVRQHRSDSARARSSGQVILKFDGGASTIRTSPPRASTSDASSVAPATSPSRAFRSTSAR